MDESPERSPYSVVQFDVNREDGPVSEGLLYVQSSWGYRTICGLFIRKTPVRTVVMLTERFDNPGLPITQHITAICEGIHNRLLRFVPPSEIVWIEHYDTRLMPFQSKPEAYSVVSFDYEHCGRAHCYSNPRWRQIEKPEAESLLSG